VTLLTHVSAQDWSSVDAVLTAGVAQKVTPGCVAAGSTPLLLPLLAALLRVARCLAIPVGLQRVRKAPAAHVESRVPALRVPTLSRRDLGARQPVAVPRTSPFRNVHVPSWTRAHTHPLSPARWCTFSVVGKAGVMYLKPFGSLTYGAPAPFSGGNPAVTLDTLYDIARCEPPCMNACAYAPHVAIAPCA
jgi:hypothetical protein